MNEKVAKALGYVDEKYVTAAAQRKKKKATKILTQLAEKYHLVPENRSKYQRALALAGGAADV